MIYQRLVSYIELTLVLDHFLKVIIFLKYFFCILIFFKIIEFELSEPGPPVIVIAFYSPSCLGQETVKGHFGLRVKLPPAHRWGLHTDSLIAERQAGKLWIPIF